MTSIPRSTVAGVAALALLGVAAAPAQQSPRQDGGDSSSHVAVDKDSPGCVGGGGRLSNCKETTRVTSAHDLAVTIKVPALQTKICQATMSTSSEQRNTKAHVQGTIETADCAACSGEYTIVVRVKDDRGETKSLEFSGSWQRADDKPVKFTADYPIGENVDLVNVRTRGLHCVCADAPAAPAVADAPAAPAAGEAPQ